MKMTTAVSRDQLFGDQLFGDQLFGDQPTRRNHQASIKPA
jgi:hypothetical protein